MSKLTRFFAISVALLSANSVVLHTQAEEETSVRLPIEDFAALPSIRQVSVSPDGEHIGITRSTSREGDYIVEIRKTDDLDADPVRFGSDRMETRGFFFINNEKIGLNFRQNIQGGNDNYWVGQFAIINIDGSGDWEQPYREGNYSILDTLPDDPKHILLSRDVDGNRYSDAILYNLETGRTNTVLRGSQKVYGFGTDSDGEVRSGSSFNPSETSSIQLARLPGEEEWHVVFENKPANPDVIQMLDFVKDNPAEVYLLATRGKNTQGVWKYNFISETWADEPEFMLDKYDAGGIIMSNKPGDRGRLTGFGYTSKFPNRYMIDPAEASLQDAVDNLFPGKYVRMLSRSDDDNAMIVYTESDRDPGTYYLLKDKKALRYIAERRPNIKEENLGKMRFITFEARDGLKIPAYVTFPAIGKKPYPTVVMPHGGPWARDVNIWDEWSQLLANNGYMVIQPQFRGSTGFGNELWEAGHGQWGLKMQDDKDDAAMFLVEKGLADPDQLAIFGWSYGGYAAFVGSMRENNIYQCSIAGAGVSDLNRISATLFGNRFLRVRQEPTIKGINPVEQVDKVNIPIMVVHGDIDYRVPIEHSEIFVEKLQSLGKEHRYVELEGADHFSDRLYFEHKEKFYSNLIEFLDNTCFTDSNMTASTN